MLNQVLFQSSSWLISVFARLWALLEASVFLIGRIGMGLLSLIFVWIWKCFKSTKCYRIARGYRNIYDKRNMCLFCCEVTDGLFPTPSLPPSTYPAIQPSSRPHLFPHMHNVYMTKALYQTLILTKFTNKLRFRELRPLAQNHTAGEWWSRDWKPNSVWCQQQCSPPSPIKRS